MSNVVKSELSVSDELLSVCGPVPPIPVLKRETNFPHLSAWEILCDPKYHEDGSGLMVSRCLTRMGVTVESDMELLAKRPELVSELSSYLKTIPSMRFESALSEHNVLSKSPFCPVCRDAGKSADEYTSHHIWGNVDRTEVICPVLKEHTCQECGEKGHMKKYCRRPKPSPVPSDVPSVLAVPAVTREQTLSDYLMSDVSSTAVSSSSSSSSLPKVLRYCKVCYSAGKSESEYKSHNIRENGVVVCPTLLSTRCHRCGEQGHTPKYCSSSSSSSQSVQYITATPIETAVSSSSSQVRHRFYRHPRPPHPTVMSDLNEADIHMKEYIRYALAQNGVLEDSSAEFQRRAGYIEWALMESKRCLYNSTQANYSKHEQLELSRYYSGLAQHYIYNGI